MRVGRAAASDVNDEIALEIKGLFDKAEKKSGRNRARAIFAIAQAVIDGVVPCLDSGDDHDGSLYGAVEDSLKRVEEIARANDTAPSLLAAMHMEL